MIQFTPEQTSFLVLGALVALLIVLVTFAIFFGTIGWKALGYAARFRGFQAGRDAKNQMTFTVAIDETPRAKKPWFLIEPIKRKRAPSLALDGKGHPIPARDLRN